MTEKEWLENKIKEHREYTRRLLKDYDNGCVTFDGAIGRISNMTKDSLTTTYDHAFTEGIKSADLDGDSEEIVDFEFEDDDEGEVEHP